MIINHHFLGKQYDFNKNSVKYSQLELELKNRNIVSNQIFLTNQIHSAKVIEVNQGNLKDNFGTIEADGMVTNEPNISLIIVTADCAPILLFDQDSQVIAAIHAGWRGAKAGIVFNAIEKMKSLGAKNIKAIIGPMIRQESYEVQQDFYQSFILEDSAYEKFFVKKSNQLFFDLPSFIKAQLRLAQINEIVDQEIDTFKNDYFYSYRQSTICGQPNQGRNLSIISIIK